MKNSVTLFEHSFTYGTTDLSAIYDCSFKSDGCIVLFCQRGEAIITIGTMKYMITKNYELIILPGMIVNIVKATPDFNVKMFAFNRVLYDKIVVKLGVHFSRYLLELPYYIHNEKNAAYNIENIILHMQMAELVYREKKNKHSHLIEQNFIHNYFLFLHDRYLHEANQQNKKYNRKQELFYQFMLLLNTHCKEQHEVQFYADKLCITTRYLNKVTLDSTSLESPKEIIDQHIVIEAKLLLQDYNISLKEVASNLNFPDQSYLSRFFKLHTGMSPSEYRNIHLGYSSVKI